MRKGTLLILIFLIGIGAALQARKTPAELFDANLNQWQSFRFQGIVQVSYTEFAARKYFALAKNKDAIRLDILDNGILGLQAAPLATVYLQDSLYIKAPTIKQLESFNPNWFLDRGTVPMVINIVDSLATHRDEILAKRKVVIGGIVFVFDKKYRISRISSSRFLTEITVTYNRHSEPDVVKIKYSGKAAASFSIDQRDYQNIAIEPLKQKQGE